ncbi:MAG: ATP synthase F0 subunit B [Myxococcota bacterium]
MTSHTIIGLLLAAAEHGAEHGEGGGWNLREVAGQWVNFILFFGVIAYLVRSKIGEALRARKSGMAKQLEEAQQKQALAEQRLSEFGHKLDHLEEEVQRIVKSFEAQGQADQVRIQQDTDKAIERLVKEADFTIHQEKVKATREVREAGVRATLSIAEKLIQERITDSDRRRLADEYVRQITPAAGGTSMPPKPDSN